MYKALLCASLSLLPAAVTGAEPVRTRHLQGEVHAFLTIRSDENKLLGMADVVNLAVGKTWRSRLTLHFRDGSVDDDTATYSQGPVLRLLTDHHVQKGPSFPKPSDIAIDMGTGNVTYHESHGDQDSSRTEHMDLPPDLGNGIMPMLLQNMPRGSAGITVGYLVATPKPRLVKLAIRPDGSVNFHAGSMTRPAARYNLHFEIGGLAGLIAPVIGKDPPDMTAWVSAGNAPTFLKLYGALYLGGPMWHLELASPEW